MASVTPVSNLTHQGSKHQIWYLTTAQTQELRKCNFNKKLWKPGVSQNNQRPRELNKKLFLSPPPKQKMICESPKTGDSESATPTKSCASPTRNKKVNRTSPIQKSSLPGTAQTKTHVSQTKSCAGPASNKN
jgi:hypothetical protein